MKKIVFSLLVALFVMPGFVVAQDEIPLELTVYYFHNTRRCATCNAIEDRTKETLNTYFEDKMKDGTIQMVTLNAEEGDNKEICEKYEVWGSTLLLVKSAPEMEEVENLTDFAFANARNNPEKFMKGLKKDIDKLME